MCCPHTLQEAQGSAEAATHAVSLESKLKVVVAELDRMQEQAALTARLQVCRRACLHACGSPCMCLCVHRACAFTDAVTGRV